MRRMSAILCLALACGPGKPDDAAGDTTDATTTANITTGAGTTTAAPPTTDGSTTGGDASTGADATTGIDGQPPSVVVLLSGALSGDELPAFAELPMWQPPDLPPDCATLSPVCDGNTAPTLGEPLLFLNGAWADLTTPVHVGDRVGIVYPYVDAECNTTCGSFVADAFGPNEGGSGSGPIEAVPCVSGPGLGLEFGTVHSTGKYEYHLRLIDTCEAFGDDQGAFEVLP